jgi:Fibronectin type III domain
MQRPPRRLAALCVSALLLVVASCTSGGDTTRTPDEGASPTGAIPSLAATQPRVWRSSADSWAITLTWQAPPEVSIDHYELSRDDAPLDTDVRETTYRDTDVNPGTTYRYSVVGVSADGVPTGPAVAKVRANAPALGDARLEGSFLVKMEVASSSGLTAEPSGGSLMFVYDPLCGADACNTKWRVRAHDPTATLARHGSRYRGKAHGALLLRGCTGGTIDETIEIQTRILAAGPVRDTWRATRIEGSLRESGKAPGCTAASITWTFEGVIQT